MWNDRYAGKTAGHTWENGRIYIMINKRPYYASRLAWMYVHGDMPILEVDHIDCDPLNNSISNLRLATRSQNLANTRKKAGRTSKYKGVYWQKHTQKWMARIQVKGKSLYLGIFDSEEEAHAAYCKSAKEHFGAFARAS
jgi:hypothetical protein